MSNAGGRWVVTGIMAVVAGCGGQVTKVASSSVAGTSGAGGAPTSTTVGDGAGANSDVSVTVTTGVTTAVTSTTGTGGSGGGFIPMQAHHTCFSSGWPYFVQIDVESAAVTILGNAEPIPTSETSYAKRPGGYYYCYETGRLERVDAPAFGNAVEPNPAVECGAVADSPNGFYLLTSIFSPDWPKITHYPTGLDLEQQTNGQVLPINYKAFNAGVFENTMTVHGDVVYTAWHADTGINRFSISTGQSLGKLELSDWGDNWIDGFSVTDDGLLIVTGALGQNRIAVYDATTGEHMFDVPAQVPNQGGGLGFYGLLCEIAP